MIINRIETGFLNENCYIISNNNKCLIVDPGDEFNKIDLVLSKYSVVGILLTHGHFDHVGALDEIVTKYNIPIYKKDNLDEKKYNIDSFKFEVVFTPGHTKDSVTYYFFEDNIMFTGDFLFKGCVGRCDLPTGNIYEMYSSLNKIKNYPNCIIYPGHGDSTSLDFEKKNNEYLN